MSDTHLFPQHPDKSTEKDATTKFQALTVVHKILSDPKKRSVYDRTGVMDEEDRSSAWRSVYPEVTKEDIDQFAHKYIGSDEEKKDVLEGS